MKETEFHFNLRIADNDTLAVLNNLKASLTAIEGIVYVNWTKIGRDVDMGVGARFKDGDAAKILHSSLVKLLKKSGNIKVLGIRTRLTDIF